ncbi:hypothetical protein Btru_053959 [Bulinus truncatus]|nr:hypothetical protein Btru_053959 [Bulinus truncatus]
MINQMNNAVQLVLGQICLLQRIVLSNECGAADTEIDCPDGSDELNCVDQRSNCSGPNMFRCDNGQCLSWIRKCDNRSDCDDGSDGIAVSYCPRNGFHCSLTNSCIALDLVCNAENDCLGGTDEFNCSSDCSGANMFRCNDDQCIPRYRVCDDQIDCHDSSDEHCRTTCTGDKFVCSNADCYPLSVVCDTERDCPDRSDEQNCLDQITNCSGPNMFRCDNGQCLSWIRKCNNVQDCDDNSDEHCRYCPWNGFHCRQEDSCIASDLVCNTENNCQDGTDELNCPTDCSGANMFRCGDGQCIPRHKICNNITDCRNGLDEHCRYCSHVEFYCRLDNQCLAKNKVCDLEVQCLGGTDEINCRK